MQVKCYINEIFENNLEQAIEHDFEKDHPSIKVQVCVLASRREMRIILTDRNYHFLDSYLATNFDCVKEDSKPENCVGLKKSDGTNSKIVKQWYLRWMKNHFETYKDDYIAKVTEIANEDLGV